VIPLGFCIGLDTKDYQSERVRTSNLQTNCKQLGEFSEKIRANVEKFLNWRHFRKTLATFMAGANRRFNQNLRFALAPFAEKSDIKPLTSQGLWAIIVCVL